MRDLDELAERLERIAYDDIDNKKNPNLDGTTKLLAAATELRARASKQQTTGGKQ